MRISTIQAFNNSVSGISRNYADLTRTQAEISAGKRLLTPADDPVGAVRLLQLNQEQALNSQYKSGITAAKNSLQQEETILNSVGTVIHRIREIAVQAGNGGLDASDKNALATELAQREDELLNLLNSRDASGKYLFSGSQGDTQPFVRNPDGTYSYNGDEGQREVQIASSTFIAISDNGKILFESGSNANRVSTGKDAAGPDASGNPSDSSISLGLVTDKEAYDTVFPSSTPPLASDGVGIHFTDAKNYVVYDLKTIQPQGGDTFSIKRQPDQEKRSLLNTVSDLRKALLSAEDTPAGNLAIRDAVGVAISNLDSSNSQILTGQGRIGARMNVAESTETFIDDVTLVNTAVISQIQDLDYPEALSRLTLQSTIMDAAQQSFVKIRGLSLFNYLS